MRLEVFFTFLLARPGRVALLQPRPQLVGDRERLGEATTLQALPPVRTLARTQGQPIASDVRPYRGWVDRPRHANNYNASRLPAAVLVRGKGDVTAALEHIEVAVDTDISVRQAILRAFDQVQNSNVAMMPQFFAAVAPLIASAETAIKRHAVARLESA